jgi:hypothetical protein
MANYTNRPGALEVDPNAQGLTPNLDYWNTPIIGNMPLSRFATIAGTIANALAPNSFGGRLGRSAAGMAAPVEALNLQRENQFDIGRRVAQMKAAREAEKQRRLGGLFERLQPQRGGFRVFDTEQGPGAYGPGRVGTSLEGVDMPGGYPQVGPRDIGELYGLLPKEGAEAVLEHLRNVGQLLSQEEAATRRALATAQNPELRGLIPPDARSKFTYGKEGLGFAYEQPTETAPKQEWITEYVPGPEGGYVARERLRGTGQIASTRPLTQREIQEKVAMEPRNPMTVGEGQTAIGPLTSMATPQGGIQYGAPQALLTIPSTKGTVVGGQEAYIPPGGTRPSYINPLRSGAAQGLRNVNPGDYVVDETGKVVFQAPPGAPKPETMSDFDTQVRAQAESYRTMTPEDAQADVDLARVNPEMYKFKQAAFYEAFRSPQAAERARDFWNRRGQIESQVGGRRSMPKPSSGARSMSGQRTSKPDGTYTSPDGRTVRVVNGVIQ